MVRAFKNVEAELFYIAIFVSIIVMTHFRRKEHSYIRFHIHVYLVSLLQCPRFLRRQSNCSIRDLTYACPQIWLLQMAASGELDKEELTCKVTQSLGYKDLKEQKDAIMYFISSRDVFVALPTRFGNSLIYGCLPHRLKKLDEPSSIVIVVSPLKALMKDQADKFKSLGVNAAYVGDKSVHMESFISGQIKLIFISPESLNRGSLWRSIIESDTYQELVVGLVVDEAHLVKNW